MISGNKFNFVMFIVNIIFIIIGCVAVFTFFSMVLAEKQNINLFEHYTKDNTFKNVSVEVIVDEDVDWCGKYFVGDKSIKINKQKRCEHNLVATLYHEYGHYIYYELLNLSQRREYCNIYYSSSEVVSLYALEGTCTEDFAESYMYHQTGTKTLEPGRYIYFKRLVNDKADHKLI